MDLSGANIGEYRLGEELGAGGMGTVYRATNSDNETVAVKIVHPQLLGHEGAIERFVREARIGQRIHHENVVRTLGADSYDCDGKTVYALVMEYVEGQTLAELRDELGHLPEELCRHVGLRIARALAAIHDAGAVHRDIKPSNVLITPDHAVKVTDLGVAMLVDEALKLTRTGDFLGSILYAAPEQFDSQETIDGRADLYALGILLYEIATGRHPYGASGALKPAAQREIQALTAINPALSPFLDEVTRALLAPSPEDRPESARLVAEFLDQGETGRWWLDRAARRPRDLQPRRRLAVPRDTRMFGRGDDMARLRELYDEAAAGNGRTLLLQGEAGIGKTRLIDEFVNGIEEPIHFLFGNYPPGGAATATGALASALLHHFGDEDLEASLRTRLPDLDPIIPAFAALLRGTPIPTNAPALGGTGSTRRFCKSCAPSRPSERRSCSSTICTAHRRRRALCLARSPTPSPKSAYCSSEPSAPPPTRTGSRPLAA